MALDGMSLAHGKQLGGQGASAAKERSEGMTPEVLEVPKQGGRTSSSCTGSQSRVIVADRPDLHSERITPGSVECSLVWDHYIWDNFRGCANTTHG